MRLLFCTAHVYMCIMLIYRVHVYACILVFCSARLQGYSVVLQGIRLHSVILQSTWTFCCFAGYTFTFCRFAGHMYILFFCRVYVYVLSFFRARLHVYSVVLLGNTCVFCFAGHSAVLQGMFTCVFRCFAGHSVYTCKHGTCIFWPHFQSVVFTCMFNRLQFLHVCLMVFSFYMCILSRLWAAVLRLNYKLSQTENTKLPLINKTEYTLSE